MFPHEFLAGILNWAYLKSNSFILFSSFFFSYSLFLPYLSRTHFKSLWLFLATWIIGLIYFLSSTNAKNLFSFFFFFSVKVIVKFIRKGIHFQQTEGGLSLEWEQQGQGWEREKHFLFPTQEMVAKSPNLFSLNSLGTMV
jgi:hypothetical protein